MAISKTDDCGLRFDLEEDGDMVIQVVHTIRWSEAVSLCVLSYYKYVLY